MRHLVYIFCFFASTALAVDSNTNANGVDAVGRDTCKASVSDVGDSMPAGTYSGQCLSGKPDGVGEIVFNNGDRFSGEFKNGRIDGTGTWTSGSSGNTYKGNWRNGKRNGAGTYVWSHGAQHYVGEWADDKRQGQGTFTWANGDRFEGEFRNNQQYTGKYYSANGHVHTCYMGICR
jgi:hypothetical protein